MALASQSSKLTSLLIGSYESYIRAILPRICAPVESGGFGYRAVVVNYRGCRSVLHPVMLQFSILAGAGVPITSPQLYSAGSTDDFRQALMYISYRFPKATLHGLGFSLGSNVLTKYIAEEGEQTRLHSGCALACVGPIPISSRIFCHDANQRTALGLREEQRCVSKEGFLLTHHTLTRLQSLKLLYWKAHLRESTGR